MPQTAGKLLFKSSAGCWQPLSAEASPRWQRPPLPACVSGPDLPHETPGSLDQDPPKDLLLAITCENLTKQRIHTGGPWSVRSVSCGRWAWAVPPRAPRAGQLHWIAESVCPRETAHATGSLAPSSKFKTPILLSTLHNGGASNSQHIREALSSFPEKHPVQRPILSGA